MRRQDKQKQVNVSLVVFCFDVFLLFCIWYYLDISDLIHICSTVVPYYMSAL